jgi:hypothetical protein
MRYLAWLIWTFSWVYSNVWGFDGHHVNDGSIELEIPPLAGVLEYDRTYDVTVLVSNTSNENLQVLLRVADLVDEWRSEGESAKAISLAANQRRKVIFGIAASAGAHSALYPAHVYATYSLKGQTRRLHAVRVFEAKFPLTVESSEQKSIYEIPALGRLSLTQARSHQVGWHYFGKDVQWMPTGWMGSAAPSRASFGISRISRGGLVRSALTMHPAWYGGAGTVFADYLLKLPKSTPLNLTFANAIRDERGDEPKSDGVTFRVWIDNDVKFEKHTASKTWIEGVVDLDEYAGKNLKLRLECHPGPAQNTTCDSAYWAEPVIRSGKAPKELSEAQREQLRASARELAISGKASDAKGHVIRLDGGYCVGIALGEQGIVSSAIAIAKGRRCVAFDGVIISILGNQLGRSTSSVVVRDTQILDDSSAKRLRIRHELMMGAESCEMLVELCREALGLKLSVECDKRITDLATGAFDCKAERVYWGHGYCIVDPKPFKRSYGGHSLSTSHVGFDFAEGLSLVTACNNPPDYFEVIPADHTYALHTHMNASLIFVPSAKGALDAAIRYRQIDKRQASPGFKQKAGRFVFDIWGGRYHDLTQSMRLMAKYGLTDALLTVHVWQRWGYDYRLPDIYPPNPAMGSLADMQALGATCDAYGIKWGLHDNYIDYYPDAEGFSYDHICHTEAGEPIKAWNNTGRSAQSYRWRPDRIMPFVQRNWNLIAAELKPSHVFTDVFTSIGAFDFYERDGTFHSSLETRERWGESSLWIQKLLGPGAVTTSEAGADQLVGYLDGADCQHLNISATGGWFNITLDCADWARVPWFDIVLHDRFSLHGVGYPGRYEGGRSRLHHGIESDDYLSNEMLLGHALMVDRRAMPRGAIRKYWLAQDFIRSIATDFITSAQFVDGDIHRQIVEWQSGAKVYVNRSQADWQVAGRILPEYGYYAINGAISSSIERINGTIVEQSASPGVLYVNGRGFNPEPSLAISPVPQAVEYLGGRKFKMPIAWDVRQAPDKDLSVFVHFKHPRSPRYDKIAFQGDERPRPGVKQWQGLVFTGKERTLEIPAAFGAGEYDVHIGLYDPANGSRFALDWDETGHHTYVLGKLLATGSGADVTGIRLQAHVRQDRPMPRWNVARQAVKFPGLITSGAIRCELGEDELLITPLPQPAPFRIALDLDKLTLRKAYAKSVVAVDVNGRELKEIPSTSEGNYLVFNSAPADFAYRIKLSR